MARDPRDIVGLPFRPFLYTLDQIASLLDINIASLKALHLYFDGRSIGAKPQHQMMARNIAPPNERPDWRVTEQELIRWMRIKRFKVITRSYFPI